MTAPIVHIGYHKTATTWFQQELFPLATSHDFIPRKVTEAAFLAPPGMHFDPAAARAVLGLDGRERPVLLSEENLSGYLHNGGLHGLVGPEMARRIHAVLPDARIVIFVRNQFDILRASYAQYVSGGGNWGQRRYFDSAARARGALTRPWKAPMFEYAHFEFDRLVACYDGLFGRERVHVYPYEWLADRDAMIDRLEAELGLAFGSRPPAGKRANPSMGVAAMALVRLVNLLTRQSVVNKTTLIDLPGGQGIRHAAKAVARRIPFANRRAAQLPADVRARAAALYPDSNRRLMALRELPLDALGYPL
jgi:hypothetical protein